MYYGRVVFGILLWAAALVGGWLAIRTSYGDSAHREHWFDLLVRYATSPPTTVSLEFSQATYVGIGDPIFFVPAGEAPQLVGAIAAIEDRKGDRSAYAAEVTRAQATFYSARVPVLQNAHLEYFEASSSLAGVITTLLPPAKRKIILDKLAEALNRHETEILETFRPFLVDTLADVMTGLEQDITAAIARHRPELDALGAKYHREIIDAEIVPMMRDVLIPIVRSRVEPVANQIGLELWQRASLWRFGWRYLYDTLPIMNESLVETEWKRFLSDEAAPVVEQHADELVDALGQVVRDTATNEQVRQVLRSSFSKVAQDPEFQKTMGTIFREVVVDNPRLRNVVATHWSSAKFQDALSRVAASLEPTFREIGDIVLGNRVGGVTPEFARVLRQQILDKDRRWFLLVETPGEARSTEEAPSALTVLRSPQNAVWPPVKDDTTP